jgi:hypothetical protein
VTHSWHLISSQDPPGAGKAQARQSVGDSYCELSGRVKVSHVLESSVFGGGLLVVFSGRRFSGGSNKSASFKDSSASLSLAAWIFSSACLALAAVKAASSLSSLTLLFLICSLACEIPL